MGKVRYGHLKDLQSISKINEEIRKDISDLERYKALKRRLRQSAYIHTLLGNTVMTERYGKNIGKARGLAKIEYTKTVDLVNKRMKALGINHLPFDNHLDSHTKQYIR